MNLVILRRLLISLFLICSPFESHAISSNVEIVALVNDRTISSIDLSFRANLFRLFNDTHGISDEEIYKSVLDQVVEDALYFDTAKLLNVNVSYRDVQATLTQSKMLENAELKKSIDNGLFTKDTVIETVRANLIRQKVLTEYLSKDIQVNEGDIDKELEVIENGSYSMFRVKISAVNSLPNGELAEEVMGIIKLPNDATFNDATFVDGYQTTKWLNVNDLSDDVKQVISAAEVNASKYLKYKDVIFEISILDKFITKKSFAYSEVNLNEIVADSALLSSVLSKDLKITGLYNCESIGDLTKKYDTVSVNKVSGVIAGFIPELQRVLIGLNVNDFFQVNNGGNIQSFMFCGTSPGKLLNRDHIREVVFQKKVVRKVEDHVKNLHKSNLVEVYI